LGQTWLDCILDWWWGDQGDFDKESAHLKPSEELINWGNPRAEAMVKRNIQSAAVMEGLGVNEGRKLEQGQGSKGNGEPDDQHDGHESWDVEVYKGKVADDEEIEIEDGMLELDLDEDEAVEEVKLVGIAVYYSRKSFNPQVLFSDMLQAWSIQKLVSVDKIGDYIFKVKFATKEKKRRVVEGGPWRHKRDALIVVHHDGLCRPSEIKIQTIGLWIRFYDLPPAMMKPVWLNSLGIR
jgi:hypothetical protein